MRRRVLFSVLLAGLSLLVVELLLRGIMRDVGVQVSVHKLDPDPVLVYTPRPGAHGCWWLPFRPFRWQRADCIPVTFGPHGFRDRPRPAGKPQGVFRIALVGDSLTFGQGVLDDETASVRLERILQERFGPSVEVWNFGISGYNIEQEVRLIQTRLGAFNPDLVLLLYYTNDNCPAIFTPANFIAAEIAMHTRTTTMLYYLYRRFIYPSRPTPETNRLSLAAARSLSDTCKGGASFKCRFVILEWDRSPGDLLPFMIDEMDADAVPVLNLAGAFDGPGLKLIDHIHLSPAGNDLLAQYLFQWLVNDVPDPFFQAAAATKGAVKSSRGGE